MGPRQKLNQSYFAGSLLVAALIGWAAQSWLVFLLALVVLVTGNVYGREIRFARRDANRPRKP